MLRLLVALALSASFVEVTVAPPAGACEAPGAIACVELSADETLARVSSAEASRYVLEDASGVEIASGAVPADGFVPLLPGTARLLVY